MKNLSLNKKTLTPVGTHFLLILIGIIFLLPLYSMFVTSLTSEANLYVRESKFLLKNLEFSSYKHALQAGPWGRYFFNSLLVSSIVTLGQLVTASMAGYAFARFDFVGKNLIFYAILGTMMIPVEITIIPNYMILSSLGWLDSYYALIIPFLAHSFGIFFIRQHVMTIPEGLFDAAQIDGCGYIRSLWKIVLPLSKPTLATVGLITFLNNWNTFLWPMIVTNSDKLRTVQIALARFQAGDIIGVTPWNQVMAATVIVTLPIIVVFLLAQKQLISGMMSGGMKF